MSEKQPCITIVMPCYNEEDYIEKAVLTLIENNYPEDKIQILVVDGRSQDKTQYIVNKMIAKYPFIKLLDNPNKTVPYALNIAIRESVGEFILRVDAHSEYPLP